jgi:hypothetical protein
MLGLRRSACCQLLRSLEPINTRSTQWHLSAASARRAVTSNRGIRQQMAASARQCMAGLLLVEAGFLSEHTSDSLLYHPSLPGVLGTSESSLFRFPTLKQLNTFPCPCTTAPTPKVPEVFMEQGAGDAELAALQVGLA